MPNIWSPCPAQSLSAARYGAVVLPELAALRGVGVRAMGAPVGGLDKGFWTGAYLCAAQSHVA